MIKGKKKESDQQVPIPIVESCLNRDWMEIEYWRMEPVVVLLPLQLIGSRADHTLMIAE